MVEEENKRIDSSSSVKKTIIILGFLLFLLVVFISVSYYKGFGKGYFIYEGKGGKYRIDKVKFENMTEYHVHFTVNERFYIYKFRNDPRDLEGIYLEDSVKDKIINKQWIYVIQDIDDIGAKSLIGKIEFIQILGKREEGIYKLNVQAAFTTEVEETPVVSCEDANESIGVIYLKLSNENKIYSDNECVVIKGVSDEDLLLSSEKFAYHLLEVF